jgi:hypothetical protein
MCCADGYREGTRSMRRCVYRRQLDLETLVATRRPNFPLSAAMDGRDRRAEPLALEARGANVVRHARTLLAPRAVLVIETSSRRAQRRPLFAAVTKSASVRTLWTHWWMARRRMALAVR